MKITATDFFPHSNIRPGQDKFLEDLSAAFEEKKIMIAHAPTGLGKTACALAAAVKVALEHKKKIFFLTNRHTQHRIAVETILKIKQKSNKELSVVDMIGKRWMCSQEIAGLYGKDFMDFCKTVVERGECEFYTRVHQPNKTLTVEAKQIIQQLKMRGPLHSEELVAIAQEEKCCGYELSLALAKNAEVIIGDYNYVFNHFVQQTLFNRLGIQLEDIILIVDEGHNLPGRVAEMLSSSLTSIMLKNSLHEAKRFSLHGMEKWLEGLQEILVDLQVNLSEEGKLVTREEIMQKIEKIVGYEKLIEELELAGEEIRKKQRKSFLGGVAGFLQQWKEENQGYARIFTQRSSAFGPILQLSYLCLDPSTATAEIFAKVHTGLIMSGTLKPTFMYKDLLGIERAVEKEYFSPFPPENKLNLVVPETSTKYNLRGEEMFANIGQKCSELSGLIPGNVAFFFPSYVLRDQIGHFLRSSKRLFWEKQEMSKEEKEVLLAEFKAQKEKGGVLLGVAGANFAEGVDFPGDLLQGVVVVGLPLSKPDLKTKELIDYFDKKFHRGWDYRYTFPAMSKCTQSA